MLITVYTMVFTCPCLWALIRFCREWAARRRMVVLPDRKPKKKPDIAVPKGKAVQRTQAEILAEQRERVKNLHAVGDPTAKKTKVKSPKRKGPPIKKAT